MSQNKNLPIKIGILCGSILGIVVTSIAIIRYKTGMIYHGDHSLTYVYWTIFALTIVFAVFRYKKLDPISFSFKHTILIGLFAGLFSGGIYIVYIVILNNFIDTELSVKVAEYNEKELLQENPELTKEEVSESLPVSKISTAVRGFIYMIVCMTVGIGYALASTLVIKRVDSIPIEKSNRKI